MEFKDYYQTLGIGRDATADQVKKAFRKLARKYHPDVSKEPDAERRMKEVNEAYTVLSDPEKRAAYDQVGHGYQPGQEFRPPPGWDTGFEFAEHGFSPHEAAGFSDFFAELFGHRGGPGGAFHRHAGHGGHVHARGGDHHARVMLDLEDTFQGATRQISLRVPQTDEQGRPVLTTRTLNVKIPRGVFEGQIIRLAGQGEPGVGSAPPGDLLLEVVFRPHHRLHAQGRDLHLRLPLAPWEAALGANVQVDLPAGSLKVKIPPGSQSGQQLRVRGKGIPGNPPGDLMLDLQVVLPQADSARARELYDAMAQDLSFDPRQREGA